jgi:hypothetical protein
MTEDGQVYLQPSYDTKVLEYLYAAFDKTAYWNRLSAYVKEVEDYLTEHAGDDLENLLSKVSTPNFKWSMVESGTHPDPGSRARELKKYHVDPCSV